MAVGKNRSTCACRIFLRPFVNESFVDVRVAGTHELTTVHVLDPPTTGIRHSPGNTERDIVNRCRELIKKCRLCMVAYLVIVIWTNNRYRFFWY